MSRSIILVLVCVIGIVQAFPEDSYMHPKKAYRPKSFRAVGEEVEPVDSWKTSAQEALENKLKERQIIGQAKNVIMFLGDGWGVTTMTAARVLKGQEVDKVTFGEEGILHTDTFPHTGTSKTYCVDAQVADSACSATAYLCGVKANSGTMGVNSDVPRHNCTAQRDSKNHVSSILAWAQAAGKATGIVTTTRITHASPGGTYSHIANRDWECDEDMITDKDGIDLDTEECDDIAEQLILSSPGKNIDVIMGGGRRKFLPNTTTDFEGEKGERLDGKNLVEMWKQSKNAINATYIESVDELMRVDASKTDALFGLFSSDHIAYYHEQKDNKDPSLADMTKVAINILKKNPNGFFLFVEGGRIDHAHHDNFGLRSLWEAVEFDRAIKQGDEMTDDEDTLIVITADHSHAFSFAGYADRGSALTGFGGNGHDESLPYSTLNYANGPGFKDFVNNKRHNMSKDGNAIHDLTYRQIPLVKLDSETHGGEDVMIIAKGPFSHLLTGVQQQNYIPHVMAYASCVGSGRKYCDEVEEVSSTTESDASVNAPAFVTVAVLLVLKCFISL